MTNEIKTIKTINAISSSNIIVKNEYIKFVTDNKKYTESQKKILIWYFDIKNKYYVDRKTNRQISKLINYVYKFGDIDNITKVKILFGRFTGNKLKQIIHQIKSDPNLTDDQIIELIFKLNKNNLDRHKIENNNNQTKELDYYTKKNKPYTNDWKYMIESIIFKLDKLDKLNNSNNSNNSNNLGLLKTKYLDIGCGNGSKTKIFGNKLNINQSNLHGCDIMTWGPYKSNKDFGFNFSLIQNGKLPYADNSFDIITAILTLHHVSELNDFIMEIKRVLKIEGKLILIEHNVYNDTEAMIIDVQHLFFGAFTDNNLDFVKNEMHTTCYNQMEWEYIFNKHNMKCLHNEMLFPQLENRLRYDSLYYAIYQK